MKYSYNGTEVIASSKKEAITKIVASEHSRILKSRIKRWIPASYEVKDLDLDSFEVRHPNCKNIVATEDYQSLLSELRRYAKSIKFELSKGKESILVTVLPLGNKVVAFNKDNIRENTKLFYEDMNKGEFMYNYRIDDKFQDFIDRTLEDEIHDVIRSDKNLIRRCIENKVKNYSIVWSALVQIFEDVRKRWNLKSTVTNELIKNWFAYNDTDYKTSLKKIVDNLTEFREELRESELFKKGDKVNISGDISNGDYNCRVSSTGVVEENQKTPNSKIRVTIDEIDGDKNVSMLVNPNIVTLASTQNNDKEIIMKTFLCNGQVVTSSTKEKAIKVFASEESQGQKTSYKTVNIGGKTWMAENLAYDDGGKGIFYNPKNKEYYYTWYAAKRVAKKLGWKLPSDEDWNKACEACGGIKINEWDDYEKCSLKEKLRIKLAGNYSYGSFNYVGSSGYFWSVSELSSSFAWRRYFDTSASVARDSSNKALGFSLRLVK